MAKRRVFRDPIYGYIELPADLEPLVNHPLYQRLRRVAQTSLTSSVYPSATGTRFEHGLGVMHLARRAWAAAWDNGPEARSGFVAAVQGEVPGVPADHPRFFQLTRDAAAAVALLHDLGHPPFSHVLEQFYEQLAENHLESNLDALRRWQTYRGKFHEFAGQVLLPEVIGDLDEPLRQLTERLYSADPDSGSALGALHSIVAGEIDVDRLDYLMRDAQKAGTEFGAVDYDRLVESLELHETQSGFRVAPGIRARSAVETVLIQRTQSYKWITFHPRVVGSNSALARGLDVFFRLCSLEEEVRWNGHSLRLDDLFSALRPNLNYLAPGSSDLQLAVRGRFPSGEADPEVSPTQLALADRAGADLMEEVRLEIQAGVDDGVVIDVIKRALLLSRVLLDKATVPDKARTALTRFVTYGEAAAFRSRNYVPLWKTVEDFGHYVDELMHAGDLIVALGDAFNEVRTEFASSEALEAALAAQQQRLLTLFENDPTVAVNHLFRTLLSTENNQRRLAQALKPPHAAGLSRDGFWEVAYTGFDPVRTRGVLTVLYRGAQPVILLKNSPLVQALEKVEENRSRLFIYYFLPWPQTFRPWDAATLLQARRILSAEFIETFPSFVRIVWAEYLRNFVRRVAAKLQNQSGSSESVT